MAFSVGGFFDDVPLDQVVPTGVRVGLLHDHGCAICPLNHQKGLLHPQMPAHGASPARIYMLGEAPGEQEDKQGIPFIGPAGQVLRFRIPKRYLKDMRWNNVVRTRPPKNRDPNFVEIECCRPSIRADIEATKPVAIFGFGNVPLHWVIEQAGITKWRGKRIPVRIGQHACWYFPMLHPSYVLRVRQHEPRTVNDYGSDEEFAFAYDLKQAFAALPTLPKPHVHKSTEAQADVATTTDVKRVVDFIKRAYEEPVVGIDYETNCLRPYSADAKLLTVALSCARQTLAFPLFHSRAEWTSKQLDVLLTTLSDFLYDAPAIKVAHHLAFELEWTAALFGKEVVRASKWEDTLSQAFIIDPRPGALSLDFLCLEYFGIAIKNLFHLDVNKLDKEPLGSVLAYNAVDAKYCRLLYNALKPIIHERQMQAVYEEHLRRVPTMVLTQQLGIPVDQKVTQRYVDDYERRAGRVDAQITGLTIVENFQLRNGRPFKPASTKDVLDILTTDLNLSVPNTDEEVMRSVKHPIGALILESRKYHKVLSTYLRPMLPGATFVFPDGRLHPTISTCRTRTQRTASEFPNEQNWPKRGEGYEVREQVKAPANHKIISFDYSGIQARNVAMESQDANLVKAFRNRYDIHADWLERIIRVYPSFAPEGGRALARDKKLYANYRHKAKNKFVFPSLFGAQPKSVGADLGVGPDIARALQADFFGEFSGVNAWHKRVRAAYEVDGYVTGLSGFRRYAPVRYNEQVNTPIQSDESAIVCDAMSRLSELDERYQAIMEIHDDLTFIAPAKQVDAYADVIIREMLHCPLPWVHIVPLGVEMSVGDDWYHMEKVGEWFSDER